jgi:hypothetical protein
MREVCRFMLRHGSIPKMLSHMELRTDCRKSHTARREQREEVQLQERRSTVNFETVE